MSIVKKHPAQQPAAANENLQARYKPLGLRAVMAGEESTGDGRMAIRFLPRGGATGGSLDLIRPSGSGVRLRVDWFSGRVEQEAIHP